MNTKEIKELVKILDGTDITEFEFEEEGVKVSIKKGSNFVTQFAAAPMPIQPMSAPSLSAAPLATSNNVDVATDDNSGMELSANQIYITSPMVGVFYQSANPDSEPYVKIGDIVEQGEILCIIEAMKLMNEILNEQRGRIVSILVADAQPVEYGQPLFVVEKL